MQDLLNGSSEQEFSRFYEEVEELKDIWESYHKLLMSLKKSEEEIRQKNEQLKELNETKDKFFSIISHDLRSPFQGLLGVSKVLVEEFDSLTNDELKNFISSLNDSLINQYKFLDDLLNWSRIQSGKIVFKPRLLHLDDELNKIYLLLNTNIKNKSIRFSNKVPKELSIFADADMLALLLRNLLSNAIKFTPNKGLIEIYAIDKLRETLIEVRDTGIGIEEENISKLFRLDTQHSTAGTNNEKGNGLGLVLCKEIVEKHGGKIWVESQRGIGSSFKVTFPKSN